MDEDQLTQLTQNVVDPRREGKNNSGLCVEDISDVVCILHAGSPAAYKLVAETAQRAPQHVLANSDHPKYDFKVSPDLAEEQETFIVDKSRKDFSGNVTDLALRFSSKLVRPSIGFVFGRNANTCDIVVTGDAHKRVSNTHFCIYFNESGVLMLRDMSTNGTVVDSTLLNFKAGHGSSQTHMLDNGSIIQVLSPTQADIIKFIVRIPSREGYETEYSTKLQAFMYRWVVAQNNLRRTEAGDEHAVAQMPMAAQAIRIQNTSMYNRFGMHWSGGPKYNVVGLIGKGAFATVYRLATKSDGTLFAAKELEKRKFIKNGILDRKLDNEMSIMRSISHPNIVRYVDYQDVAAHLYIIMEYLPYGDLQQYLSGSVLAIGTGPLAEDMARRMADQVLHALNYLHDQMITHRDIKPDNILIADLSQDSFTVKLSDFGLSKVVKDNDTFLKTFCGTLLYCAPEVFPFHGEKEHPSGTKRVRKIASQANSRSYSQAVDVWSFGAVLWYSLCLKPPFEGVADKTGRAMFEKIMRTPLDVGDLERRGVSSEAIALLVEMLSLDPMERPSPQECLHHAWFGNRGPAPLRSEVAALGPIVEEEGSIEPDLSQLKLCENFAGEQRELSLDSSDLEYFQSKRFKSNAMDYRDQDSFLVSSGEVDPGNVPGPRKEQSDDTAAVLKPPKLFGEISRSDLQGMDPALNQVLSNGLVRHESSPHQVDESQHDAQRPSPPAHISSSSFLETETGVRDIYMASPFSSGSSHGQAESASANNPQPLQTHLGMSGSNVDVTRKAAQAVTTRPVFDRQIRIPLTASYYYDPRDLSTHNVEYASKVSGHDFTREPYFIRDHHTAALTTPAMSNRALPMRALPTQALSLQSAAQVSSPAQSSSSREAGAGVLSPIVQADSPHNLSRPWLGRLVSTSDSFANITLEIRGRLMSWGRAPSNTNVHPFANDKRVPKHALTVYFHAPGLEDLPRAAAAVDDSFVDLPGLYSGIITHASAGIWVNDVPLPKTDAVVGQRTRFGRLYSGDEITVWKPSFNGEPGLRFVCEFSCGAGKVSRPLDRPRFEMEMTSPQGRMEKGK